MSRYRARPLPRRRPIVPDPIVVARGTRTIVRLPLAPASDDIVYARAMRAAGEAPGTTFGAGPIERHPDGSAVVTLFRD